MIYEDVLKYNIISKQLLIQSAIYQINEVFRHLIDEARFHAVSNFSTNSLNSTKKYIDKMLYG